MCSRGNMSFIVTEGPAQVGRKAHVVTHPPHTRSITHSSLYIRVETLHTHESECTTKTWRKLLLLLPLSLAGQEVPPSSTCSHTGIDVTLYSRAQRSPVSAASLPVFLLFFNHSCSFSSIYMRKASGSSERPRRLLRRFLSWQRTAEKKKNNWKRFIFIWQVVWNCEILSTVFKS